MRLFYTLIFCVLYLPVVSHSFSGESQSVYVGSQGSVFVGASSITKLMRNIDLDARTELGEENKFQLSIGQRVSSRFSMTPYSYNFGYGVHMDDTFQNVMPGNFFRLGMGLSLYGYKDNMNYDAELRTSGSRKDGENQYFLHRLEFTVNNNYSWNTFFNFGFYHKSIKGGETGFFLGMKK